MDNTTKYYRTSNLLSDLNIVEIKFNDDPEFNPNILVSHYVLGNNQFEPLLELFTQAARVFSCLINGIDIVEGDLMRYITASKNNAKFLMGYFTHIMEELSEYRIDPNRWKRVKDTYIRIMKLEDKILSSAMPFKSKAIKEGSSYYLSRQGFLNMFLHNSENYKPNKFALLANFYNI